MITTTSFKTHQRIGAALLSLALALLACNGAGGIISGSSTSTPMPTPTVVPAVTATATPTPAPALPQLVVQQPDKSVQLYQPDGQGRLLTQSDLKFTSPLYRYFARHTAVAETLYLVADDANFTARVYSLSASGVGDPLNFIEKVGEGFDFTANTPAWVAWDTYTTQAPLTSQIFISALDGSQKQTVLTETNDNLPQVLVVAGWSQDGQQLYFSREPLGIGGYILFGGISNLSVYSLADGSSRDLISSEAAGMICLDALSPDEQWVADHCATNAVAVRNLKTGERNQLALPAGLTEVGGAGSARFSPDGTRVAYSLARHDPENEQGWAAVSEGLSGGSHLIATGSPGGYFTVAGWLDANTVVLQFWGATSSVWLVSADGSDVKRLAEGTFLGFWE